MSNKVETGFYGQDIAQKYLVGKGMDLLETNFRSRQGEIDLIMQDGEYTVFVEVKYRRSLKYGLPREAIGTSKQKKILQAAKYYIYLKASEQDYRFDVVEVLETGNGIQVNHIENAFW